MEPSTSSSSAVFQFDARVRYSEVDHRGLLTLPKLIDYFQDCSTFQSEALGVGMLRLKEHRRSWVLTHWQIVVERYPRLAEPITVGTFASSFKGLTATRYFFLKDATGEIIAKANSSWALLDLEKGRPTRPAPEDTDAYGVHDPLPMPEEDRRVRMPDTLDALDPITVLRYQIDTNEHVNNSQYVQMALELLPRDIEPARVRVDYKRAAVLGDTIYPKIAREEGRAVIALCSADDQPYAIVEFS